jgi:hypothetical protein
MSVKREELVRDSLTLNLSRLYARVSELEERIESGREDLLEGYHEALREFSETFRSSSGRGSELRGEPWRRG